MKKTFIALLALLSFGMASSVHAFFDPINTPVLAIFGGPVAGINAPMNKIDDQKAICAKVHDQKLDQTQKQVQIKSEKDLTLPMPFSKVGGNLPKF